VLGGRPAPAAGAHPAAPRAARLAGRVRLAGFLVLRLMIAAGLAVDAYVHADLAPAYDGIRATVSQGDLFRVEAGAAAAAALVVFVAGRRAGFGLAFAVAAGGLGALLLYRYVDVGRIGPLPNMYEPSWFPEKTAAAVAEAGAAALAAGGLIWAARQREPARAGRRLLGLVAAGAVLAGVAVGGFAGNSAGTPAAPPAHVAAASQKVTIAGTNALRFTPMTVRLHTGTVRITLTDMGAYPHNIVIPALGVTSPTVTGDPGSMQVSFTVTFTRPGRYAFDCQYHASAGMTGMFVVS
jgi:plastocyanin